MRIRLEPPQVGLGRFIATVALCTIADVLWCWAVGLGLNGAHASWRLYVAGIVPWMVGWVTLLWLERRIKRDLRRASEIARARQPSTATPVGRPGSGRPVAFVQAVEGKVLPR